MQMVQSVLERIGGRNEGRLLLIEIPAVVRNLRLNQITAFIDMGFEVEIVALQKATPRTPTRHGRNTTLPPEPLVTGRTYGQSGETAPPSQSTLRGIHRKNTWQALNLKRYGQSRGT